MTSDFFELVHYNRVSVLLTWQGFKCTSAPLADLVSLLTLTRYTVIPPIYIPHPTQCLKEQSNWPIPLLPASHLVVYTFISVTREAVMDCDRRSQTINKEYSRLYRVSNVYSCPRTFVTNDDTQSPRFPCSMLGDYSIPAIPVSSKPAKWWENQTQLVYWPLHGVYI